MRTIIAAIVLAFAVTLTTCAQEKMKADAGVEFKGKLPAGWSTQLHLTMDQKKAMYKLSAGFQQKIADIRDQEYRAMYGLLTNGQKALLKAKVLD